MQKGCRGETQRSRGSKERALLELGFPSLTCILPADEPDQVVHLGVGDGHHGHGLQLVLACVQWEVDIDFFGCCCTNMALWRKRFSSECIKKKVWQSLCKIWAGGILFSGETKICCYGLKLEEAWTFKFQLFSCFLSVKGTWSIWAWFHRFP